MKRVILTGGTGFIGANLARRLLNEGHDVHMIVRPEHDQWRIVEIEPHVEIHAVDLRARDELRATIEQIRPDWIFHLAVYGAYSWQQDSEMMWQTNVVGTTNLVEAGAKSGFEVLVNAGSSSEYGFVDHPATEEQAPDPNSEYAFTKACATLFCRYFARRENLNISTLRLYSAYGPFEDPKRLLPTLIVNGLDGRLPRLVSPDIARDFVYIDDVVEAFILAARIQGSGSGAIYNVASGAQRSIREVVALVRDELGVAEEPRWGSMETRAWDTTTWTGRTDKIKRDLGWNAAVDMETGVRSFTRWFLENPDHAAFYASAIAADSETK